MLKKITLLVFGLIYSFAFSQLDDTHYFPPLRDNFTGIIIDQQSFYISTPETSSFDVFVYQGTSTVAIDTLRNLSNSNSIKYDLDDGINNVTVIADSITGVVNRNTGLRFIAPSKDKFYVNYRCKSGNHAGSLTCKGQKALGTNFRWGGIPSSNTFSPAMNDVLSFMASEDDTTITISDFNPGCNFRLGDNSGGITDDIITINLNANETFVLEAIPSVNSINLNGWLGATINATKPVAINSGGFTSLQSGFGDITIDQIVPTSVIGQQYGFIRGNGGNESEFPIIVATKDNTEIFVNGTLYTTINDGEFVRIPGSFYSNNSAGANLFVEASKKVYAYQCLTGERNKIQTIGMNFIPPLVCLLPSTFDQISDIADIAGSPSRASAITLIAAADTPNNEIQVFQNNIEITKPIPQNFTGNSDWKSFFIDNLTGDVKVISTGNIVVGFFVNDGGNAGFAGYFSGFDNVPDTEIVLVTEGGCFPDGKIGIKDPDLDGYQWYKNNVAIPGAIQHQIDIPDVGTYYADITIAGCTFKSESFTVGYCYDIEISKKAEKDVYLEGDNITYEIDIENKGKLPLTNLSIEEKLPKELTIDSHRTPLGLWSSNKWEIDTLNINTAAKLELFGSFIANTKTDSIINTIEYSFVEEDSNFTPDNLRESVFIIDGEIKVDVKAELTRPYRIIKGDSLTYTFKVKNTGDLPLSDVNLSNTLFSNNLNEKYISGDVNNDTILNVNEEWIYKDSYFITQGEINRLLVPSITNVNGKQSNDFIQTDEVAYDYAIDPDYVVPYIDLALKLDGNGPGVLLDEEVKFNLLLTSDNSEDVTDLTVRTKLPEGFNFISYTSEQGRYNFDTGEWKIDTLKANSKTKLNIIAQMNLFGSHTLESEIGTFHQLDSITTNNKTELTIEPICFRVFNEFSPNGDGINDYLVVQCLEIVDNVNMKIFNRVGNLVYENPDYDNDFNGYANKGNISSNRRLPNGTYFYVLDLNNGLPVRKGWIFINR